MLIDKKLNFQYFSWKLISKVITVNTKYTQTLRDNQPILISLKINLKLAYELICRFCFRLLMCF